MIEHTVTLVQIEHVTTIAAYVISIASAAANLPIFNNYKQIGKVLLNISKVINFLALNIHKIKEQDAKKEEQPIND